jgi:Arc/MetJ-type ribon-helix-helix transcriptional regulator
MAKTIVSCGFSQTEIDTIDNLVKKGYFASRSDAIRTCTNECLVRRGLV